MNFDTWKKNITQTLQILVEGNFYEFNCDKNEVNEVYSFDEILCQLYDDHQLDEFIKEITPNYDRKIKFVNATNFKKALDNFTAKNLNLAPTIFMTEEWQNLICYGKVFLLDLETIPTKN